MIRRTLYFLLVFLILGGLAGGLYYYAFIFKPKMLATIILGSPKPAETVSAEAARVDSWQPQVSGIGSLTAPEGIFVTPQVGGIVGEIGFDSGQLAKKGQLLVKLDSNVIEAQLRSTEAQLANAETDLARRQGLATKGYAPKSEIDQLRSQRDSLKANADQLKALIEQKTIYAPWDGRVGLRTISVGSYIGPGDKIVWLQKIDPIFADFDVTETDFGRVTQGEKVTARFKAWPDQTFDGKIVTTDARMSDQSRMITVRAEIANPDGKLLPGMYADVMVDSGKPMQVVTVPQTAVTFSLYGDNVFVVVPASKSDPKAKPEELAIERRFVKAGAQRDGRVEIVDGIKPGEKVVTAGQNKIDQGTKVTINNSIALRIQDTTNLE